MTGVQTCAIPISVAYRAKRLEYAAALGDGWTDDVEQAWTLAYNLTSETMMLGAMEEPRST